MEEERDILVKELDYLKKQVDKIHQIPLILDSIYVWPLSLPQIKLDTEHQRSFSQDESIVLTSGMCEELKRETIIYTSPSIETPSNSQDHRTTSTTISGPRRLDMRSHLRHTNGSYGLYGDLFTLKTIVKLRPIYPSLAKAVKVVSSRDWMVRENV